MHGCRDGAAVVVAGVNRLVKDDRLSYIRLQLTSGPMFQVAERNVRLRTREKNYKKSRETQEKTFHNAVCIDNCLQSYYFFAIYANF